MRIIDLFDRSAAQAPDTDFLVQGEVRRSYRDSQGASQRVASVLQAEGFAGAHVAFWSPNDWRLVEALLGIFRAGAVMVPLNARNAVPDNINVLNDAGAELLLIHERYSQHITDIEAQCPKIRKIIVIGEPVDGAICFEQWSAGQAGTVVLDGVGRPEELWAIYATSGTTGRSKCVAHTHMSAMSAVMDMTHSLSMHDPVRHLVVAPISHFAGIFLFALSATGSTHILLDSTDPAAVIDAITRHDIEVLFLPPTLVYLMLAQPDAAALKTSALRALVCAGAPIAPEKMRLALETFGPVMMNFFAQTETIGPLTALRPSDYVGVSGPQLEARLGSIGRPSIMRKVEIMDDDGNLVPSDTDGEIVVRGWGVTPGYLRPDGRILPDEALFAHGWLHTGDVGRKSADGYITLIDRKKDMIISGGFNVYPFEIEQVLLAHKDVLEVAVVGVPDEKWGEAVMAIVQSQPGAIPDAAGLIAFCKAKLGSVKAPKKIEFWDELPRNATGKVMKRVIRETFWQGRERRV